MNKQKIYTLFASGEENIKTALQLLKGQPDLKKEIETEVLPILAVAGKKSLKSLASFLSKIDQHFRKAFQKGLIDKWLKFPFILKAAEQLTKLNLSRLKLEEIPSSIDRFKNLKQLHLQVNRLEEIPESIGNLIQLEQLLLDNNNLIHLPESIGQLTQLEDLDLGNNQLIMLPKSLGNLTLMRSFNAYNNDLKEIPDVFDGLVKLYRLNLYDNPRLIVPPSAFRLKKKRGAQLPFFNT